MNILFIQREGTDLHHTLFASETSRLALRFYHPKKMPCGVSVSVSTLGSALSLVSELKWYIRRYVREVLFEIEEDIFCTHQLAQDVYYERTAVLAPDWKFRRLYGFANGRMSGALVMSSGSVADDYRQDLPGAGTVVEVWCREDEVEDIALEDAEPSEDENPDGS